MKEKLNLINKMTKFYTSILTKTNEFTIIFNEIDELEFVVSGDKEESMFCVGGKLAFLQHHFSETINELLAIHKEYMDDCCCELKQYRKNDNEVMIKLNKILQAEDMECHRLKLDKHDKIYKNKEIIDFSKYLKGLKTKHNKLIKEFEKLNA